nr:immunoglobulin light chain junction region [Macaca mulatta]
CYQHSSGFTF